ncbi:MAG: efflux RND transporter periplasmic adaptor subunit [Runella slithyformis]|nr:MAG: efflux RND transporter periplasmic adaptor subunit [Runella slithyformis]TAF48118.1 MAG: efflux RND transporter periplasmic adaptor subunit [Runella slithyformis]TAF82908.1 MAG: efflux RND transporter periplasmic adaptor subunit [Runella slithyformis]
MKNHISNRAANRLEVKANRFTTRLLAILIASLSIACSSQSAEEETADAAAPTNQITLTDAQYKSFGIATGSFETRQMHQYVQASGSVEAPPQSAATVSFPIAGYVKSVGVSVGQLVEKGKNLATLESMEAVQMQQDYLQTSSNLVFLEQELSRQRTLSNEEVGAKRKLQQAEADFQVAKAAANALEIKLNMLGISPENLKKTVMRSALGVVSPLAGYVKSVRVNIGKAVAPNDVLFEIVSKTNPQLLFKIYEKDANKVTVNQTFTLQIKNQTLRGVIASVSRNFDADTRTLDVRGRLQSTTDEAQLIMGQYITTQIDVGSQQVLALPEAAIIRKGETAFVFVETAARHFERVAVKIGAEQNGFAETSFLKAMVGPKIVLKGARLLEAELLKSAGDDE